MRVGKQYACPVQACWHAESMQRTFIVGMAEPIFLPLIKKPKHGFPLRPTHPASDQAFINPFHIADLGVFDAACWQELLGNALRHYSLPDVAYALHGAPLEVTQHLQQALPPHACDRFTHIQQAPINAWELHARQSALLDVLFWPLTYWQTPACYDELTVGEQLHPAIMPALQPLLAGQVVADIGAGSGRLTFACLAQGAAQVVAIDPCPALLEVLAQKAMMQDLHARLQLHRGSFEALPLADASMDTVVSCAAFTVEDEAHARQQLEEIQRVLKPRGHIVFIWPRSHDVPWFRDHGLQHVVVPVQAEMTIRYSSHAIALRLARRFYGRNPAVEHYLLEHHTAEVPFHVVGMHPPCDYCWC